MFWSCSSHMISDVHTVYTNTVKISSTVLQEQHWPTLWCVCVCTTVFAVCPNVSVEVRSQHQICSTLFTNIINFIDKYLFIHMFVLVWMHGNWTWAASLQSLCFNFWETLFHWAWSSQIQPDWQAIRPQQASCLHLPSTNTTGMHLPNPDCQRGGVQPKFSYSGKQWQPSHSTAHLCPKNLISPQKVQALYEKAGQSKQKFRIQGLTTKKLWQAMVHSMLQITWNNYVLTIADLKKIVH